MRLGHVRLLLPSNLARLGVDDLHEDEVLHAPRVVGPLVGGADLAGDEELHAELLAVLRDVPRVEHRVLRALDLPDHLGLTLLADDARDLAVDEPALGVAQHGVELRIDVLVGLVDERRDGDRLPVALPGLDAPLGHDRRVAHLVEERLQRALDVVLVEAGAHRGAVDARIVGAAHVFAVRAPGQRDHCGDEREGRCRSE